MSTYLELVNKAIYESGADLEQLTSANFASPPDVLQIKFKNWVNDAWRDIQLERDWRFTKVRSSTVLLGGALGVNIYDTSLTDVAANNWVRGTVSGAQARINAYLARGADSTAPESSTSLSQGILYLKGGTGLFQIGEPLSVYNSANSSSLLTEALIFTDYPEHSLRNSQVTPETIDKTNVYIWKRDTLSPGSTLVKDDKQKLTFLEYEDFRNLNFNQLSEPEHRWPSQYITITPRGLIQLYPELPYTSDELSSGTTLVGYQIEYDYKLGVSSLTASTDIPSYLNAQYHDMVAWRAVMYYANDDSKPDRWRTARNRYEPFKRRLEEELIEQPKWAPNPYKYYEAGKR
jgi:hypothetical protein